MRRLVSGRTVLGVGQVDLTGQSVLWASNFHLSKLQQKNNNQKSLIINSGPNSRLDDCDMFVVTLDVFSSQ